MVPASGLDEWPDEWPLRLASPSCGADAAQDEETDYDAAAAADDGPTRPPRKILGRGNNWPVTRRTRLRLSPPLRLASPSCGADAALDEETDYAAATYTISTILSSTHPLPPLSPLLPLPAPHPGPSHPIPRPLIFTYPSLA